MTTTSIQPQYTLKVHLYTFVVSVLFCLLMLDTDKDFGKENLDGGTLITLVIFILISQIIALGGNAYKVRSNAMLASICYSVFGLIIGFAISVAM